MDNLIEEILDEIIEEASSGIHYNNSIIKFHTLESFSFNSSYNDNVPTLVIRNKKEIVNKLKQYVELVIAVKKLDVNKTSIKKCIISLFSTACYEDFSKPSRFIENYISFYLNDSFLENDKIISEIVVKKIISPISKSLPYTFKMYKKENDKKYYFPNISYGISGDVCYIYGIEKVQNKDLAYAKKIEDEYDIDMLTLTMFIQEIYNYGISEIKVVSCLPMQYEKQDNLNTLLDSIVRLSYILDNVNIVSNPFEKDEYMNIEVEDFVNIDNYIEKLVKEEHKRAM